MYALPGLNHETNYARSDSLFGNYTGDPENPVLTNANTTEYCELFICEDDCPLLTHKPASSPNRGPRRPVQ